LNYGGGLYIYNLTSGKLSKFNEVYGRLTSNNIVALKIVSNGDLWIATNGGGVNIINLSTSKMSFLFPGEEKGSLRSGAVSYVGSFSSRSIHIRQYIRKQKKRRSLTTALIKYN
jgi:hypothetical protein